MQAYQVVNLGLPTPMWTAIGLTIFYIGIGILWHESQKDMKQIARNMAKDVLLSNADIATLPNDKRTVVPIGKTRFHNLSNNDWTFINSVKEKVFSNHGHEDKLGIIADFMDEIPLGNILSGKCKECGKPRNKPVKECGKPRNKPVEDDLFK